MTNRKMKDITIIIPVLKNDVDEKSNFLYKKSFESVLDAAGEDSPILIIGEKEAVDVYPDGDNITKVINEGSTGLQDQILLGVTECKTKYFTVIESDDFVSQNWLSQVEKYRKFYPDIDAFIPLTEIVDYNNFEKGPLGYVNEPVWASAFSKELGYIDLECLQNFSEFNLTGAVFNKKAFTSCGGLKPSMKFSYWYEFLLRFINNDHKAFVVPKVGYTHILNRPDSVSMNYYKTMTQEEADWWLDLAQKEYLYKKDRKKTYEQ